MGTIISSVTRQGTFEPFELQVSRGQIQGHKTLFKFGNNVDIAEACLLDRIVLSNIDDAFVMTTEPCPEDPKIEFD